MGRGPQTTANKVVVEAEYRAGIKTIRQIADEHGVSEAAIRKWAKKEGWEQNLTDRIRIKAEEKIARHVAAQSEDVVEANADALYRVELTQRKDIQNLRELVAMLTIECQAQCKDVELFKQLGDLMATPDEDGATSKLDELYRKVISIPGRVTAVKQLAETLKTLVDLERRVLRMDEQGRKQETTVEDLLRKIGRA